MTLEILTELFVADTILGDAPAGKTKSLLSWRFQPTNEQVNRKRGEEAMEQEWPSGVKGQRERGVWDGLFEQVT